jgi:hypothetical protein
MNNFGQDHPCKLFLELKLSSSKVATFKQILDCAIFEILQINSNLHTTTTIVCQLIYESNPPKFITKFQNKSLEAIWSSTLCAKPCQLNTCYKLLGICLNHHAQVSFHTLLEPLDQSQASETKYMHDLMQDKAMPWHDMPPTMLTLSPLTSSRPNHVIGLSPSLLSKLDTAPGLVEHGNAQNTMCPDTPRRARARQTCPWERQFIACPR